MFTFGRGNYGCLGHGNSEDKLEPCLVQALKEHSIVDVALGTSDAHTLCVTDNGLVFAFGGMKIFFKTIIFAFPSINLIYCFISVQMEIMANWATDRV